MNPYEMVVVLSAPACRRCVRRFSRLLADISGVAALRFDAPSDMVRIYGSACGHELAAALPRGAVRSYARRRRGSTGLALAAPLSPECHSE